MHFVVKFRDGKQAQTKVFPHVVLSQDNWDDHGYKTTFEATIFHSTKNFESLGYLKILHKDQTDGQTPVPTIVFESLGPDYCSVGGDISYYEKLLKCGLSICNEYLEALGDVAFSSIVRDRFDHLEGYKVSLMRFSGAERIIADASALLAPGSAGGNDTPHTVDGFAMPFKTQVASGSTPFIVDFNFVRFEQLPHRINVVIGYNGTGKTRLLSNLAIVASGYGYESKADVLKEPAGT